MKGKLLVVNADRGGPSTKTGRYAPRAMFTQFMARERTSRAAAETGLKADRRPAQASFETVRALPGASEA